MRDMSKVSVETARAKVNLFLDIEALRADGYHDLVSLMFETRLHDRILVSGDETGQRLDTAFGPFYFKFSQGTELDTHQEPPTITLDGWSIVRALKLYLDLCIRYDREPRLSFNTITLERNIPAQAGLGGASSDAAALLRLIVRDDPEMEQHLMSRMVEIGADVPFSYRGGIALATKRGEVLEPRAYVLKAFPMLMVKPDLAVSTAQAFGKYDAARSKGKSFVGSDLKGIESALESGQVGDLRYLAKNTFVELLETESRDTISAILSDLYELDALYANMTGSGPTCFALFVDEEHRDRSYEELKRRYGSKVWFMVTRALN